MARSLCRGILLFSVGVTFTSFVAAAASSSMIGVWQGGIQQNGEHFRVLVHVASKANGSPAVTLDSPDTGALGIPLRSVKVNDDSIEFELKDPAISFNGKLSVDRSEVIGDWRQNGQSASVTLVRLQQTPSFDKDGPYLFQAHCITCHTPFNSVRAPWSTTLRQMSRPTILASLENGKMRTLGAVMSHEQRVVLADYLGVLPKTKQGGNSNACSAGSKAKASSPLWNGWGVDLSNSRFQSAELGGLDKSQIPRLRVKWAFGYPGATSGGGPPTIIGQRIYVAGGDGQIYALDSVTGCVHWTFLPQAPSRTAITVSNDAATAYFGDAQGRAYAIKTATGALIWATELDQHPFAMVTGAPKLYDGVLYVPMSSMEEFGAANPRYPCCTFRGSVSAVDARTGMVRWKTYTISAPAAPTSSNAAGVGMLGPSGAGVWSSPTIDPERHALYIGTGDNYSDPSTPGSDAIIAIDLKDGRILWVKQLTAKDRWNIGCMAEDKSNCPPDAGGDFDIGAPPILRTLGSGKRILLVGQKSGVAYGLDPDDFGKTVWESRIGNGGTLGGIEFGGAADDRFVFLPLSDLSPDPKAGGGVFALDVATGQRAWSSPAPQPTCVDKAGCSAAQQGPATLMPGVVFAGSFDGHIRAYDVLDGKILWDFDTAQIFKTVNSVEAQGGSISYSGPVVAGGTLFVTSGYSQTGGMPGNVLLAFSVEGK